jgi:hypothetical protein
LPTLFTAWSISILSDITAEKSNSNESSLKKGKATNTRISLKIAEKEKRKSEKPKKAIGIDYIIKQNFKNANKFQYNQQLIQQNI